jgi:hypothetical protein
MQPYQELEITKELIEKVKSTFIQVITLVKPVRSNFNWFKLPLWQPNPDQKRSEKSSETVPVWVMYQKTDCILLKGTN